MAFGMDCSIPTAIPSFSMNAVSLHTPGFAHYAIAWSPFHPTRLALASAANFGLVGNGRLHLVSVAHDPAGSPNLSLDKKYRESLSDVYLLIDS
jgi:hypothetical protein